MNASIYKQEVKIARRTLERNQFLLLINAAIRRKKYRFAKDAALNWLSNYRGDLQVGLLYSKALIGEGRYNLAKPIIESICQFDPEFVEAVEILYETNKKFFKSSSIKSFDLPLYNSNDSNNTIPTATVPEWLYALKGPRILSEHKSLGRNYEELKSWAQPLWQSRRAMVSGEFDQSEKLILLALGANPATPIVQVIHLKFLDSHKDTPLPAKLGIAEHYHKIWPNCLQINLYLAHWLMAGQEQERAIKLLHQVASNDVGGQVINRTFGMHHPYKSLWPDRLELRFNYQIPIDVASELGWNQIPARVESSSETNFDAISASENIPEFLFEETHNEHQQNNFTHPQSTTKKSIQKIKNKAEIETVLAYNAELEKMAKRVKKEGITSLDNRFPIYVVFSVKRTLEKKYGLQSANKVIHEMIKLVDIFQDPTNKQAKPRWGARLFMPDDPLTLKNLNIKPVDQSDPWKLKLAIRDLDDELAKKGEMIGALLIVGGPEVVPFHHLPNPIDDMDAYVASDNPYSTKDENYFIPGWPVGRLPGGRGTDPNLLIKGLRKIQQSYTSNPSIQKWYYVWLANIISLILQRKTVNKKSIGFTAEVWQKASQSVFQPIGDRKSLLSSPPLGTNGSNHEISKTLSTSYLGYFNLHGLEDSAEWYGQSDPQNSVNGVEFPVAFSPEDINPNGISTTRKSELSGKKSQTNIGYPRIIFSEACYGANIMGKSIEEALSLMFLSSGSQTFVGATCMSYGSIDEPLIAADLLGHLFWKYMREGMIAGEAFRQAKISLAQEMHNRQGYLDGEDQKTLISFVLYGDPLAQYNHNGSNPKYPARQIDIGNNFSTICDRSTDNETPATINIKERDAIKQFVAQYLPGMRDAELICTSERAICHANGHVCPTSQFQHKSNRPQNPNRKVVTLQKQIANTHHTHNQYARLTIDGLGNIVKIVVSR